MAAAAPPAQPKATGKASAKQPGAPPPTAVPKGKAKAKAAGKAASQAAASKADPVKNARALYTKCSLVTSQAESFLDQLTRDESWAFARKADMQSDLMKYVNDLKDLKSSNALLREVFSVGLKAYEKSADTASFHQAVSDINEMECQISQVECEMAYLI
ncbi:unnamed protein product [Prorocentrum cordatum]|uniref:Uncharacterized protein n=1 Tax=Prorocentrum cordatum TaxID=2364126 RepID=A0ABN9PRW5_9DINO|nr:unnamed protein product [Polarella glacialis]